MIAEIILLIYSVYVTLIVIHLKVKSNKRELEYLNELVEKEQKYSKAFDTIKSLMGNQ